MEINQKLSELINCDYKKYLYEIKENDMYWLIQLAKNMKDINVNQIDIYGNYNNNNNIESIFNTFLSKYIKYFNWIVSAPIGIHLYLENNSIFSKTFSTDNIVVDIDNIESLLKKESEVNNLFLHSFILITDVDDKTFKTDTKLGLKMGKIKKTKKELRGLKINDIISD